MLSKKENRYSFTMKSRNKTHTNENNVAFFLSISWLFCTSIYFSYTFASLLLFSFQIVKVKLHFQSPLPIMSLSKEFCFLIHLKSFCVFLLLLFSIFRFPLSLLTFFPLAALLLHLFYWLLIASITVYLTHFQFIFTS